MEEGMVRTLVNAGGLFSLAFVITILHLHNVRVVLPEAQKAFHAELQREREMWAHQVETTRLSYEARHRELMDIVYEGRGCKWERDRRAT